MAVHTEHINEHTVSHTRTPYLFSICVEKGKNDSDTDTALIMTYEPMQLLDPDSVRKYVTIN